ncbi:hypothetical protein BT96DRAFT_874855 [Gymnopus androsaceus JB14]|uniref:P-loop containing nucleoside triphosphate hydrolase protein n=1 Tax=Gymnopus androsaceus JB14 TaxID=1447944 RepID=A0A6A4IBU4_9AGAR|nr:hypothetical protein BT96DRAFT_874855 [Gymnopus androsaceus JB14]
MSAPTASSEVHTKIFVYSHPRTRSNLFMKLLETHPQVVGKQYPFMFAFQNGPEAQWSPEKVAGRLKMSGLTKEEFAKKFNVTYQSGLDDMEKRLAKANAEGRVCVIKEHTYHMFESKLINANISCPRPETPRPVIMDKKFDVVGSEEEVDISFPIPNPSLLPDRIIASVSPVIIIRHPMFTCPSFARATSVLGDTVFDTHFTVMASYRWQKMIYEFYRAYYDNIDPEGKKDWPVVIDGDRLIQDTQGQMKKFCALIGMDESLVKYSWDASNAKIDKAHQAFVGTIEQSTGIIRGLDASNTTLEEEVKKWTEEWDENVAQKIKTEVESSMEDYEYLLKFSI